MKIIFYFMSAGLYLYALLLSGEVLIVYRHHGALDTPSFTTQYLHPYYFFSFPQREDLLQKMNSATSWVDARGYRGPGPEARGSRDLAFLVGGSTAFGDGAPENSDTIAAHLNTLQEKYFFVNAGVPSWNSFQELLRVIKQCIPENPRLVISLDGVNDYSIAHSNRKLDIPLDSPESYDTLDRWVEDIRSGRVRAGAIKDYFLQSPVIEHLLLRDISERLLRASRKLFGFQAEVEVHVDSVRHSFKVRQEPMPKVAAAVAKKYLYNLKVMHDLSALNSTSFFSFFQPVRPLHKSRVSVGPDREWAKNYLDYKKEVIAGRGPYLIDLSDAFADRDGVEDLFIDDFHFNANGNREVAKIIVRELKNRGAL